MFDWRVISGYFIGYFIFYILTHTSRDLAMIMKHPGKAKYPYPKSHNIFAIVGFCISTILFWIYIIIYPIHLIMMKNDVYNNLAHYFVGDLFEDILRIIGMIVMSVGVIVGALGRWARGDYYAHNETQLQTRLGFAIVRHPNYFQYMCGFIGMPLITLHLFTLILPLIGIYGYYIIAKEEENRLQLEFDDKYRKYQTKVGMFFPKFSPIVKTTNQLQNIMEFWSAEKIVGVPINPRQKIKRKWFDHFKIYQGEPHLTHPYYYSNESSGNQHYRIYTNIVR
jgi:protein-S-isoprenylcysteine O-methyltransferase Ste14